MSQVDKVRTSDSHLYNIGAASGSTVPGTTGDSASPSSFETVAVVESGTTMSTFFEKVTKMIANVRYIWSRIGNSDFSSLGETISAALVALKNGKANSSHTHSVTEIPTSGSVTNSNTTVPLSSVLYSVKQTVDGKAASNHNHDSVYEPKISTSLPINKGGTGATTAAAARSNLGITQILSADVGAPSNTGIKVLSVSDYPNIIWAHAYNNNGSYTGLGVSISKDSTNWYLYETASDGSHHAFNITVYYYQ